VVRIRACVAVAALLAVAACGGKKVNIAVPPPSGVSSTPTTAVAGGVGSPSAAGSTTPTGAVVPGCPAESVGAAGGPFCYPLPAGFRDFSARDDYAYGWQWRTLVSVGPHDLIEVLGHPVSTDLTALAEPAARSFVEQLRLRPEGVNIVSAGALKPTTVDGKRAYQQDATYTGGIEVRSWAVLTQSAAVYVSCQMTSAGGAKVKAACDEVVRTLQIG
jgi:hypothetical protein